MSWRTRVAAGSERGSIPMALLAVLVVGIITATIFASTISEGRATRFDENYTSNVHVAEAGVDEALYALNNDLVVSPTPGPVSASIDGVDYTWTLQQLASPNDDTWIAQSTGGGDEPTGPNSVERTLRATIREAPLFDIAAFADIGVEFNGGNTADSYNSAAETRCSMGSPVGRPDCYGLVGSNGDMVFVGGGGGSNTRADRTLVYNYDARPDGAGITRCTATGGSPYCSYDPQDAYTTCVGAGLSNCPTTLPYRVDFGPPKEYSARLTEMDALLASCTSFPDLVVAEDTSVVLPYDGGQSVCLDDVTIGRKARVTLRSSVTPENPLRLYVTGDISIGGGGNASFGARINIQDCDAGGDAFPCSTRLYIYSSADDSGGGGGGGVQASVSLGNHVQIAAAVFAPLAACGGASNAQAQIYGSMICREIGNVGGWQFHYDEALRDGERSGKFFIERIDEIPTP